MATPEPAGSTQPAPAASQDCTSDLKVLAGPSLPLGAAVSPGQDLEISWQVQNTGTCNWDVRFRLRRAAGASLEKVTELALYPAVSGAKGILVVEVHAPAQAGTYRAAWQAFDPQGTPFGEALFFEITVP